MEGTKLVTDTSAFERRGREVFLVDRSFCVSSSEPQENKDPAMSSNVVGLESRPPKL